MFRPLLVFPFVIALAGCGADGGPDGTDASGVDDTAPGAEVGVDVAAPDAGDDVVADAPDAAAICSDLTGLYQGGGSCSGAGLSLPELFCVRQDGCAVQVSSPPLVLTGTVTDTTASVTSEEPTSQTCDATGDAARLDVACELTELGGTCEGAYGRIGEAGEIYCCDVREPDCPNGRRCQVIQLPELRVSQCIDVIGDVAEGEACERVDGLSGHDDCAPGLFCANWGSPDPTQRACHRLCVDAADCGDGASCLNLAAFPPTGGCSPLCDPLADPGTCADGARCGIISALAFNANVVSTACLPPTTNLGLGEQCPSADACAGRLQCAFGVCREPCDPEHPCPDGQTCEAFVGTTPGFPEGLGACTPAG
ncbi:MAG: hypothetical protein H6697_00950 [Myxococcales bacterium]|nr:hypothetical protein [Myxococcales bacterium]MCB9521069.1 hypothetical protein [Myxococcales bacterium]